MPPTSPLLVEYVKDVAVVTFTTSSVIDTQYIEQIRKELHDMVEKRDKRRMVLDLTKVSHLSSAALGVLIPLQQKVAKAKGHLVLCGLKTDLRRVFKITNLEKQFQFADDEAGALAAMGVTIG